ncbi:intestinal colonization autotransporter adhesin MisL, partial [Salmonella enterica subsp. enterica serovar Typhimurium]
NFSHEDGEPWQTLTINEDYVGNGGKLVFNTVLNDDDSETDRLQVLGNTSGNTFVAVNNIGGAGAQTIEGIEIVNVAGNSNGTFEKASRIVAGAYDYNVVQKGKNWYLTSYIEPDEPIIPDPVDPVIPDPVVPDPVDPDPVDPVIPDPVIPDPVDPDPVDPEPVDPVIPDPTIPDIGQSDTPPITEHQFR